MWTIVPPPLCPACTSPFRPPGGAGPQAGALLPHADCNTRCFFIPRWSSRASGHPCPRRGGGGRRGAALPRAPFTGRRHGHSLRSLPRHVLLASSGSFDHRLGGATVGVSSDSADVANGDDLRGLALIPRLLSRSDLGLRALMACYPSGDAGATVLRQVLLPVRTHVR